MDRSAFLIGTFLRYASQSGCAMAEPKLAEQLPALCLPQASPFKLSHC